jgi:hypothetical protein
LARKEHNNSAPFHESWIFLHIGPIHPEIKSAISVVTN